MPRPLPEKEAKPRQFRLTDETTDALDDLARHLNLSDRTAVVRVLVAKAHRRMQLERKREKLQKT